MVRKKQVPSTCTSRGHKLRQIGARNQESDGEEDRISNLPECLLSNILSRLPTKDAVGTCVLSKKWEYKWTGIYNLDLDDRIRIHARTKTRQDHFGCFVDRVLMRGIGSLRSFILRCSNIYDPSQVHAWISAALRRNAEILEIDIWSASLALPPCIYASNSLKELRLISKITMRVPDETLFSKLKKIDFSHVILRNQDLSTNNGHILLEFPLLESLSMYCCKWRDVKAVKLDAPLLTSFHMTYASQQFGNRVEGIMLEICGSNLADLRLNGELSECYVLPKSSAVETATIKLFAPVDWILCGFRIARTLRQMNALKYLELSCEVLIALTHAAQIDSLPLFASLIHLKLYTTYFSLKDSTAIISLIQRAPVLQMLTMDMSTTSGNDLQYDESQGDGIPACFSYHLKVTKFVYAFDCLQEEKDLGLMKFILKNARVLEQMQFISQNKRSTQIPSSPEIQTLLLSFPRGSSVAQIVLIS